MKYHLAGTKPALLLGAALLAIVLGRYAHIQDGLRGLLSWMEGLGSGAPPTFMLIYTLACILFIPGFILTLGAGVLFGVVWGSLYVSVAATLGATAAFLIGRTLARGWVSRRMEGNARFVAIDEGVAQEGWKIVLLTRLSPVFPFNLLNYVYGLTRVSLKHYFLASWLGMLPGTIMYVYLGSLVGNLAALGGGIERAHTPAEWAFYGVGLAATVAVALYAARVARRALKDRIDI